MGSVVIKHPVKTKTETVITQSHFPSGLWYTHRNRTTATFECWLLIKSPLSSENVVRACLSKQSPVFLSTKHLFGRWFSGGLREAMPFCYQKSFENHLPDKKKENTKPSGLSKMEGDAGPSGQLLLGIFFLFLQSIGHRVVTWPIE